MHTQNVSEHLKATVGKLPDENELERMNRPQRAGSGKLFPNGPRLGAEVSAKDGKLVVRGVKPGSLADDLGLREGDVLKTINGEGVARPEDVARALGKDEGRVAVEVERGGATHTAVIERR